MKPERLLKCIQVCTGHLLSVSLLFFVTAFLHFPLLLNSSLILQFDEAIQASEIIRLMKGEAFFFYFDYARYHGILHGVLAIPFFWLLGISATAYKLTPVLYYAAYIWTTYLLAKAINKKVALITLILLIIPSLTMSSMATHNWQNSLIIVLGNLILLLYFKVNTSGKSTLWIFTFFFFLLFGGRRSFFSTRRGYDKAFFLGANCWGRLFGSACFFYWAKYFFGAFRYQV